MSKRRKKVSSIIEWWGGEPSFDDPTFLGTGAATGGTTSVNAPIPAVTIEAGDYLYSFAGTKLQGARPDTPTGFKCIKGDTINWNDNNATDVGAIQLQTYEKRAVGGESGNIAYTFPGTNANSILASVMAIRPDTGAYFDTIAVAGGFKIMDIAVGPGTDVITSRSYNKIHARRNDFIVVVAAVNADTYTWSEQSLSGSGLTISTITQEVLDTGTSQGNDQRQVISIFKITAGTANDYMTFSMRASATALRSPIVVCHFLRIRQVSSAPSYRPSRYQITRPEDVQSVAADNANTGVLDYMAWDKEGTPVGPTLSLENYLGELHIVSHQDFTEATVGDNSIQRRSEVMRSPRQPRFEPATKAFDSFRNKTASLGTPFKQFIFFQDHPGSQGAAPNHPIIYFEWGVVDQQGIDINGDPVLGIAGALVIAVGMAKVGGGDTTSIRTYYVFNDITIMGTKDHRFEILRKYGLAGDGHIIIRHNGVTLVDRSDLPTIAATSEQLGSGIVGTGSVPLVGGVPKTISGYFHQISTYDDCQDWINAGFPEYKVYSAGIGNCIKVPSDPDYGDEYDIQTLDYIAII